MGIHIKTTTTTNTTNEWPYYEKVIDYYTVYKNGKAVWRCRDFKCFMQNSPQTHFNEDEIDTVERILTSIEQGVGLFLLSANFYDWGFVWQISHKGQRPRVYCPYELGVSVSRGIGGNTFKVEGCSTDLKVKERWAYDGSNVTLKLKRGREKLVIAPQNAKLDGANTIKKLKTSNGGGEWVMLGLFKN